MIPRGNVAQLRTRLIVSLGAPLLLASCWSTDQTQETYPVYVEPGQPCPRKEDVLVGDTDSDRCHAGVVISIDDGPRASDYEAYGGKKLTLCEYLVTREKTFTPGNSFCLGSGRPLWTGRARIAGLVRRAREEGSW